MSCFVFLLSHHLTVQYPSLEKEWMPIDQMSEKHRRQTRGLLKFLRGEDFSLPKSNIEVHWKAGTSQRLLLEHTKRKALCEWPFLGVETQQRKTIPNNPKTPQTIQSQTIPNNPQTSQKQPQKQAPKTKPKSNPFVQLPSGFAGFAGFADFAGRGGSDAASEPSYSTADLGSFRPTLLPRGDRWDGWDDGRAVWGGG